MVVNGIIINDYERLDDLQLNGLMLIQDPAKFCFGIDAVLLTDFAIIKKDDMVLDLCSGSGIIPTLLSAKTLGRKFVGLEIQPEAVEMATRSTYLNGIEKRVEIINGDLKSIRNYFSAGSFNSVTVNPPYTNIGGGMLNKSDSKIISRHEVMCTIADVAAATRHVLSTKGRMFMVHKPERLAEIILVLKENNLETKRLKFVHAHINAEPSLVLIEAVKDGHPSTKVMPPLILNK